MTHESETALSGTHPESQVLNEKGLEVAAAAYKAAWVGNRPGGRDGDNSLAIAIRAYLSAIHSQGAVAPSLDAFSREIIRDSWEGCDGGDIIQELALKHGLIKGEPFDPAVHGLSSECQPGDTWYTFAGPLAKEAAAPSEEPVEIGYTNWRGEFAVRKIVPRSIWYGSTEWHPEPQWFITAHDVEKNADRDFAMSGFASPVKGLGEKLDRMLANWEKPERKHVMLPGTQMTCDEAAIAIRVALSSIIPATKGGEDSACLAKPHPDQTSPMTVGPEEFYDEPARITDAMVDAALAAYAKSIGMDLDGLTKGDCQIWLIPALRASLLAALSAQDTDGVAKP
ncbi:hypothetical protein [Mesorhizobium sp. M0088]|uniref:hypothetical protein n=1 Tax=Mesorhizobium sp. M0088 TaxID=2956873 RepID=UPI0033363F9D